MAIHKHKACSLWDLIIFNLNTKKQPEEYVDQDQTVPEENILHGTPIICSCNYHVIHIFFQLEHAVDNHKEQHHVNQFRIIILTFRLETYSENMCKK